MKHLVERELQFPCWMLFLHLIQKKVQIWGRPFSLIVGFRSPTIAQRWTLAYWHRINRHFGYCKKEYREMEFKITTIRKWKCTILQNGMVSYTDIKVHFFHLNVWLTVKVMNNNCIGAGFVPSVPSMGRQRPLVTGPGWSNDYKFRFLKLEIWFFENIINIKCALGFFWGQQISSCLPPGGWANQHAVLVPTSDSEPPPEHLVTYWQVWRASQEKEGLGGGETGDRSQESWRPWRAQGQPLNILRKKTLVVGGMKKINGWDPQNSIPAELEKFQNSRYSNCSRTEWTCYKISAHKHHRNSHQGLLNQSVIEHFKFGYGIGDLKVLAKGNARQQLQGGLQLLAKKIL